MLLKMGKIIKKTTVYSKCLLHAKSSVCFLVTILSWCHIVMVNLSTLCATFFLWTYLQFIFTIYVTFPTHVFLLQACSRTTRSPVSTGSTWCLERSSRNSTLSESYPCSWPYRNYPMFSNSLCFWTPPIFHRNNYFLDAHKHVFRTPPIFHRNNYFLDAQKHVFRTPFVFGHPYFLPK